MHHWYSWPARQHRQSWPPNGPIVKPPHRQWSAGAFPFNAQDLELFPFSYDDIEPYYDVVAERIGISGDEDDLAEFLPRHRHLLPPHELDEHATRLLENYAARRESLLHRADCYLGRGRPALLTRDAGTRRACARLGRCESTQRRTVFLLANNGSPYPDSAFQISAAATAPLRTGQLPTETTEFRSVQSSPDFITPGRAFLI